MAMYAIAILPLIHQLQSVGTKQVWFADDATAGGRVHQLHEWWSKLRDLGPFFGYFANPAKTWLIVKDHYSNRIVCGHRREHHDRGEAISWSSSGPKILRGELC